MRKNWKDLLIFTGIAVSVPLVIILLIRLTPRPPVDAIKIAREALSMAVKDRADTYSKKLYTEAKINYDSALVNWKRQNKRFIYFRDYSRVLMFAELSARKAEQASDNSISSTSSLRTKVRQRINSMKDLVLDINALFTTYPLSSEVRNRISKGKMLLEEAEIIYKKGQYLQADRKITDAEYLLTSSYENATTNLKDYFKLFSIWESWVKKTITDSKNNRDYSIIIDKFSRKCYIYLNGVKKWEFDAELGKNWVGDKRVKGDNATPEGMYKITKKFDGRKTKYYKALLIDYPNDEDIQRFNSEIARGTLPANAKIGGLIEIHGNGGKGIDWTEGCIALTDKEMDAVFKVTKVGTPVTIVGSIVNLEKIVNR
jgi:hypothetical protein